MNPEYIFFLSTDVTRSSSVLYHEIYNKTVPSTMLSLLHFLHFSFKFSNVCAINFCLLSLQLCKTASRHFEASFELEELDAVNKLNE